MSGVTAYYTTLSSTNAWWEINVNAKRINMHMQFVLPSFSCMPPKQFVLPSFRNVFDLRTPSKCKNMHIITTRSFAQSTGSACSACCQRFSPGYAFFAWHTLLLLNVLQLSRNSWLEDACFPFCLCALDWIPDNFDSFKHSQL